MHIVILSLTLDVAEGIKASLGEIADRYTITATWSDLLALSLGDDRPDLVLVERTALSKAELSTLFNLMEPGRWPPVLLVDSAAIGAVKAVDGLTFNIKRGETMGMVGESGCGKSTAGRAILLLHEPTSGNVIFDGVDLTNLSEKELRALRPQMQMIFQDPYATLNPRHSVGKIIGEPLVINGSP